MTTKALTRVFEGKMAVLSSDRVRKKPDHVFIAVEGDRIEMSLAAWEALPVWQKKAVPAKS